jgi:VCBS repeat-containing protein
MGADVDDDALGYGIVDGTDNGDTVSKTSNFGVLTITKATGTYSFTPDSTAIEAVKADITESFTITITDGIIAEPLITTLTVNLTGANDPTNFTGAISGIVTEDSTQAATGTMIVNDRDAGDAVVIEQDGTLGSYGNFSISADGVWTYTLRDSDNNVQALKAEQTVTETFIVTTAGGATQVITISIYGSNDAPSFTTSQTTLIAGTEDTAYTISQASLLAGFSDADGDSLSVINLNATNGNLSAFDATSQSWTFTPATNYYGTVNLSYSITDGMVNVPASHNFTLAAANDALTGNLNITGIFTEGHVLTADSTLLADADGIGAFTYQWQNSSDGIIWNNISDANSENYALTALDAGSKIRLQVAFIDGSGNAELINSGSFNIGKLITGTRNNDILIGSVNDDHIEGFAGKDIINGAAGVDSMAGGAGDDTYYIDNVGDSILETQDQGEDSVFSSISFTLSDHLENLTLTEDAIYGIGNVLDNEISGNAADNVLEGVAGKDHLNGFAGNDVLNGGTGADMMIGGLGDDLYYVDNNKDSVKENKTEGNDTVYSSISYELSSNVENLILTGNSSINGTGNKLNNIMIGNDAINTLKGDGGDDFLDGGAGNDILKGGSGSDVFSFSSPLSAVNIDTISDFSDDTDHIGLNAAIFTKLFNDTDLSDNLIVGVDGVSAQDEDDYLIYNSTTKALYYDADGSGAGVAVQFATLTNINTVSASDFVIL